MLRESCTPTGITARCMLTAFTFDVYSDAKSSQLSIDSVPADIVEKKASRRLIGFRSRGRKRPTAHSFHQFLCSVLLFLFLFFVFLYFGVRLKGDKPRGAPDERNQQRHRLRLEDAHFVPAEDGQVKQRGHRVFPPAGGSVPQQIHEVWNRSSVSNRNLAVVHDREAEERCGCGLLGAPRGPGVGQNLRAG